MVSSLGLAFGRAATVDDQRRLIVGPLDGDAPRGTVHRHVDGVQRDEARGVGADVLQLDRPPPGRVVPDQLLVRG